MWKAYVMRMAILRRCRRASLVLTFALSLAIYSNASAQSSGNVQYFTGHTGSINSVAFSPDGKLVLTGSADGSARLWQWDTTASSAGKQIAAFSTPAGNIGVNSVAFSPDGKLVLTGGTDGVVRLWEATAA